MKKRKTDRPAPPLWTDEQVAQARAWRADGVSAKEIGERIGRSAGAVNAKLNYIASRAHEGAPAQSMTQVPAKVLADRDRLAEARRRQSSISALLGEPPPGWSARDMRRSA